MFRMNAATASKISVSTASGFLPATVHPDVERVIAVRDFEQRRARVQAGQQLADLLRRAERVARALHEEHRLGDVGQMTIAALLGLSRRMERIAEIDQSGNALDVLRRDLRRDAAAHGLAADEERQARRTPDARRASSMTARQCASSTGPLSGTLRPCAM